MIYTTAYGKMHTLYMQPFYIYIIPKHIKKSYKKDIENLYNNINKSWVIKGKREEKSFFFFSTLDFSSIKTHTPRQHNFLF